MLGLETPDLDPPINNNFVTMAPFLPSGSVASLFSLLLFVLLSASPTVVYSQEVAAAATPGQPQLVSSSSSSSSSVCPSFPACCEDDCCGRGASWNSTAGRCVPDPTSPGWTGPASNSDSYVPGCQKRVCCEQACCGNGSDGLFYLSFIGSCLGRTVNANNGVTRFPTAAPTTTAVPTVQVTESNQGDGPTTAKAGVSPLGDFSPCRICPPQHELHPMASAFLDLRSEGIGITTCGAMEQIGLNGGVVAAADCDYFRSLLLGEPNDGQDGKCVCLPTR